MRLLYVADGRSPIALNWIRFFVEAGDEVHLVSSFACAPEFPLASLNILPIGFSELKSTTASATFRDSMRSIIFRLLPPQGRTWLRHWLAPLTLSRAARRLEDLVSQIQPELLHAMRIPYEGMLASLALENKASPPMLLSVWGNDFTLHAASTPWMSRSTRLALRRADGLHTDCQRDARLAREWGFDPDKPVAVLPGAGGIQMDLFYPEAKDLPAEESSITVINPRGFRAYVRNDVFFQAIPYVLSQFPAVRFICPAMSDEPQAQRWVHALGIAASVELLPRQSRSRMAELFRRADIAVSPSQHDGTPNTLLEAMACGCFPLAGDIESIHEWIEPGVNGLLFDPADPRSLADAILAAIRQPELRFSSIKYNTRLIAERADYQRVMAAARQYYGQLINVLGQPLNPPLH